MFQFIFGLILGAVAGVLLVLWSDGSLNDWFASLWDDDEP